MFRKIRYDLFVPGIIKVFESNNCQYQNNFPNALCCFEGMKVEIEREKILELANKDSYKEMMDYIREIIKKVKEIGAKNE